MTDDEQEITYDDQEIIEELEQNIRKNCINKNNGNISDEQKPMRHRVRKSSSGLRKTRQKFCARWQLEFPWLRPNKVNESVGYCTICRRDLVCKKSHLERHQRSFKHMRLQGFESVFTVNEPEAELIEAHTSGYLDNQNDHDYQVEEDLDDVDDDHTTIKEEPTRTSSVNSSIVASTKYIESKSKKEIGIKAKHTRIQSPRTSFGSGSIIQNSHIHYKNFEHESRPSEYTYGTHAYIPQPKKDSFDLFFESISASVKNLPPKLAAEVKSKVSQVIAEFELRAICEKEAKERAMQSSGANGSSQVTNLLTIDSTISSSNSGGQQTVEGGVTNYVYTYQPKMQ